MSIGQGTVVGEALVRLRVVDSGMEADIRRQVNAALRRAGVPKIPVGVDPKPAEEGVGRLQQLFGGLASYAKAKLEGFAGSNNAVSKSLGEMEKAGLSTGNALKAGLVGGAVAAAGALALLAERGVSAFTSEAAAVRKLAAASGATVEEASKLRNIGQALGVDADTLSTAFFRASKNIDANAKSLQENGVQIARNKDGSIDLNGTLLNLSDAYKTAGSAQQRNLILQEAFGRGGQALRPILSANRAELEKMAKAGPTFSPQDVQDARNLSIAHRELDEAVQKLEVDLARGLIPLLAREADGLAKLVGWGEKAVKSTLNFLSNLDPISPALNKQAKAHKDVAAAAADQADAVEQSASADAAAKSDVDSLRTSLDRLAQAQEGFVDSQLALEDAQQGVADAQQAIIDGQDDIARKDRDIADAQDAVTRARSDAADKAKSDQQDETKRLRELADAQSDLQDAIAKHGSVSTEAREALQKVTDLQDQHTNSANDAADGAKNVADAEQRVSDLQRERAKQVVDLAKRQRDLERSYIDLAKAQRDNEVASRTAAGEDVTGAQKTDLLRQKLEDLAGTIKGPVSTELDHLAQSIRSIPDPKDITVRIAPGTVDALNAQARALGYPDYAAWALTSVEPEINPNAAGPIDPRLGVSDPRFPAASTGLGFTDTISGGGRAKGGPVLPGYSYDVGENGREVLEMFAGGGGRVTPVSGTGDGSTTHQTNTVNIYNPAPEAPSVSLPRALRRAASGLK